MTISTNYRHTAPAATLAEHGRRAILVVGALMLSACGGGGGSGGTVSPSGTPVATFTNWSAVQPGTAVEARGLGMQASYQYAGGGISAIGLADDTAVSAIFMFDANTEVSRLILTSGSVGMDFPGTEISSLNADADFLRAANASNAAVISSPTSSAWDYQSFGVWETGRSASSGNLGVFSVGAPTAGTAIPDGGTATFTGKVVGSYVNSNGQGHTVLADLMVIADFTTTPSLAFSTTNTQISSDGSTFYTNPDPNLNLDLTGTLIYDQTMNQFSGQLTTTATNTTDGRILNGDSAGQFYGPNAEELGGVFFLSGSGVESYRGAFGAQITAP